MKLIMVALLLVVTGKVASLSTREEIIDQLLSDILSAGQFTLTMEASKEMSATPPAWSPQIPPQYAHMWLVHGREPGPPMPLDDVTLSQNEAGSMDSTPPAWPPRISPRYYPHMRLVQGPVRQMSHIEDISQRVGDTIPKLRCRKPEGIAASDKIVGPNSDMVRGPFATQDHVAKKTKAVHYTTAKAKAMFIFDVPTEKMQESIDKFQGHIFECVANATRDLANVLRLDKKYDIGDRAIRRFQEVSDILKGGNFDSDTLQKFIHFIMSGLLDAYSSAGNSIVTKQGFGRGLIDIIRSASKTYQKLVPILVKNYNKDDDLLGNFLKVVPVLLSDESPNEDDATTLDNFIDFTLGYFLKFLGGVDLDTRDAFREMMMASIPAFLRQLNDGKELSTEVKERLIKSVIKLYLSYNAGGNDSLLRFAKNILSDSKIEVTDSRTTEHLFGLLLRNLLDTYTELIGETAMADFPDVAVCVLDGLKDLGRSLKGHIPDVI